MGSRAGCGESCLLPDINGNEAQSALFSVILIFAGSFAKYHLCSSGKSCILLRSFFLA